MTKAGNSQIMRTITLLITIFSLSLPAYAQYNGGTGEPNDPYQIATADDLMLLGESPEDYDRHFILTDNIDLNPNLPGRKVFDRAVIAPDTNDVEDLFQGTPFTGVFDGNGYVISNLTINEGGEGGNYLGLFGHIIFANSEIKNLGLENISITGGRNSGNLGGLCGSNSSGSISNCYSTGTVTGGDYFWYLGGLCGLNEYGSISNCYFLDEVGPNNGFGTPLPDNQMKQQSSFIGWDFVDETVNGPNDIWKMWDGYDYPRLTCEPGPNPPLVFVDINDPGFYGQMSKYEVTNAQYCDFLNAALASGDIMLNGADVEGASGSNAGEDYLGQRYYRCDGSGYTGYGATNGGAARVHYSEGAFSVDNGFGNHPVTYVSWYGAMAFANYYGYYLPAEDQWQAVADFDGRYIYGCGQIIDPGIANYRPSEHPDGTISVGSFGIYGYGMSDMAGNVWEWTSSSLDSSRVFRGGSLGSIDSDCDVSIRGDGIPYAAYYDIGFRVCR